MWTRLLSALNQLEEHYRDACYVELTSAARLAGGGPVVLLRPETSPLGTSASV